MTPTNSLPELLPAVQGLTRVDKWRLLQFLAGELAREEGVPPITGGTSYPLWTPHHAFGAAAVLLKALETEVATP
jgi:hypothetical protein